MNKQIEIIQSFFITSARYNFSIWEKRVVTQLINLMQPLLEGKVLRGKVMQDLFNDYNFELPISTFLPEDDKSHYGEIWQAFDQLNEKVIYHTDKVYINKKIRLVESPAHLRSGVIRFRLAEELVNMFLDFNKGFSKYKLEISLQMKSVYSMRLYELISNQYNPITYKIETLKNMFGLDGKNGYDLTHNFIKRVIQPAQKELYEKADWGFEYYPIKEGKKFTKITFIPVQKHDVTTPSELILRNYIVADLRAFLKRTCGVNDQQLKSHKTNLELFATYFKETAKYKLEKYWGNALKAERKNGTDPHQYIFGTIKKEVEQYKP